MLLHGAQSPPPAPVTHHQPDLATRPRRKRKAETQDNERLSKRLSLLNLGPGVADRAERKGQRAQGIIESRARTRARQRLERDGCGDVVEMPPRLDPRVVQGLMAAQGTGVEPMATGHDDDADAMELD
ncbi:predicted protein [Verticillium alfalfae VaMs.102]|uniref:Predicted protein n=1 Tax=Verticillium alfalfae (strain VaMs.102 / ATCC MYA-4576 / FGSC 10136) TaxID=526221 RepID=C9SH02_VERA1|nr:predicted protein [Verticillium alfalfae VaMs.102]EEY17596.1 predicted protein [Verticillium alfalfae VaMs.102]